MSVKIGINGFGRIGKLVFKFAVDTPGIEVVHLNDCMDIEMMSHLLKYDSVHGKFEGEVSFKKGGKEGDLLFVNGREIKVTHHPKPKLIPWRESGVDIVVESSGKFSDSREELEGHLESGAKKVIISSPSLDPTIDNTVVMGVNHTSLKGSDKIISNASCTTNCVALLVKVLKEKIGFKKGIMNTVHPFTNNQNLQDGYHPDPRRARSAMNNIIPTTTSSIGAIHLIYPELKERFDGFATRVPVVDCSFVELYAHLERDTTVEEINSLFLEYANSPEGSYLEYCTDPIVSSDVNNNKHSAIFDALSTRVVGGDLVQILAWYDNESGYSARVIDLINYFSSL